jgi:hypothetical protein
MNIYAKKGTKVIPIFENGNIAGGYDSDKKYAMEFLKEGEFYTVDYTEVSSWHTDVFLEEFPGKKFNSVHFVETDSAEGKLAIAKNRINI